MCSVCACVCQKEREGASVCVSVCQKERGGASVCVCVVSEQQPLDAYCRETQKFSDFVSVFVFNLLSPLFWFFSFLVLRFLV